MCKVGALQQLFLFSMVLTATSSQEPPLLLADTVPFLEGDPNFLFLGNSYTHSNNLPAIFQNLVEHDAAASIIPGWKDKVKVERRDPGGERLAGHLKQLDGSKGPQTALRQWLVHPETRRDWKWVVLQDQSQLPGFYGLGHGQGGQEYDSSLLAAEEMNKNYIQPNGAQTVFFLTWGRRNGDNHNRAMYPNFLTMQKLLTEGYRRYWQATTTAERPTYIAPVGLVFETIYRDIEKRGEDPTAKGTLFYDLYVRDGSHPSLAGSYLAALTLHTTLTGKNPKEGTWCHPQLDTNVCSAIQDAVHRTILETYASGAIEYPWQLSWQSAETKPGSSEL